MKIVNFHIIPFGEKALLVQVNERPSDLLLQWLLTKKEALSQIPNVEVIHTYNEILIKFLKPSCLSKAVEKTIKEILDQKDDLISINGKLHRIPVCYEDDYGIDMISYSTAVKLSVSDVIGFHTSTIYTIYFLGFLPGFPYLEGLDRRLALPRKETPSNKVETGAVGIGGNQTGIYPQESPGGWHIIGRTPVQLFHPLLESPSPFQAGDQLQFYNISSKEFERMEKLLKDG